MTISILTIKKGFVAQVLLGVLLILVLFAATEGVVVNAQTTSDEFVVTQTITGEIAFSTAPADVTMSTPIASLTGGTATGTTELVINTNNAAGYTMTIEFADDAAMQRIGGGGVINDYSTGTSNVPDYAFSTATPAGEFGYSVTSAAAADAATTFRNDGTDCATGSLSTRNACWMEPKTTAETIVNRTSATAASGATTTLDFQVYVPPNPTPTIPAGTYRATATITATTN